MNLQWFTELIQELFKSCGSNGKISYQEIKTRMQKYGLGDNILQLIQNFNMGFSISKDVIQLCDLKWFGVEERSEEVKKSYDNCKERLCRIHIFNGRPIPFGFWLKVLSRLMLYIDQIIMQDSSQYEQYKRSLNPTNKNAKSARDLYASNFHYGEEECYYCDPDNRLFFSVKLLKASNSRKHYQHRKWWYNWDELKGKDCLLTEVVSESMNFSCYVFSSILSHIETVLEEWHANLLGAFSGIVRCSPCLCKDDDGKKPCRSYSMKDCFHQFQMCNFNSEDTLFTCKHSTSQQVPLLKLFPDFESVDYPRILLSQCHEIGNLKKIDGTGGNGDVYAGKLIPCREQSEKVEVAIKTLKRPLNLEEPKESVKKFFEFKKEAVMSMELADHPYITTFFGIRYQQKVYQDDFRLAMYMELAKGSLHKKLVEGKHLDRVLLYHLAYRIADALNFMHFLNVLHRDLNPKNVLIFESRRHDFDVKLSDFGTACYASSRGLKQNIGTRIYQAPELFNNPDSTYTFSVDIYGYGMILYRALTLKYPFNGCGYLAISDLMKFEEKFRRGLKLGDKHLCRKDIICLQRLMERCLEYKVIDRQMNGRGLIYLLQQPSFQLLMNGFSFANSSELKVRYICLNHERKVDILATNNASRCTSISLSFREIESEEKEFWISSQGLLDDIIDDQSEVVFAFQRNNAWFAFVESRGNYDLVHVPTSQNQSPIATKKLPLNEFNIRTIKKVEVSNGYIYMYFEDLKSDIQLNRALLKSEDESGMDDDNFLNDLMWIKWDLHPDMNATIDICFHQHYKAVAVQDSVVLCTNQFEEFGFTETDRFNLGEEEDKSKIEKMVLLHPYVLVKHHSGLLTFLKVTGDDNDRFVFERNFKKTCKLFKPDCAYHITATCIIFNKVWVGTDTGHLFIITFPGDENTEISFRRLKPYDSAVEGLFPFNVRVGGEIPEFVASYGRRLNSNAFYDCSVATFDYPKELTRFELNRKFLGYRDDTESSCCSDLFLLWHATKIEGEYESISEEVQVANEKLAYIEEHSECILMIFF